MGEIRPLCGFGVAAVCLAACVAVDETPTSEELAGVTVPVVVPDVEHAQPITIDPRRSLVVTEEAILARFPLERVMDQLASQSGAANVTALSLWQQWWDTQNPKPGLGLGPHCDDTTDSHGNPTLNGFPYTCRPAPSEGALAGVDPFVNPGTNPDEHVPIGLFNRFDLSPGDGTDCGEYRIVYAKRSGLAAEGTSDRNLIIFEMTLPNPNPQQKIKGCRKIVDQWKDLTGMDDVEDRADRLEAMYFDGLQGLPPIVHIEHLGAGPSGKGQIRTNQFMRNGTTEPWVLREYKLQRTCAGSSCSDMDVVPVSVKGNPFGPLFDPANPSPLAAEFRAAFVEQVENLAAAGLTEIDFSIPDQFNAAHSIASASGDNNYVTRFGTGDNPFRAAIAARLAELGSTLTPDDIVARAQALSCAGCHRLNNAMAIGNGLIHPSAKGFVHITERETEVVDGELRFVLSEALTDHFLPKRKQVMEDYLNNTLKSPKKPKDPIGGRRVH